MTSAEKSQAETTEVCATALAAFDLKLDRTAPLHMLKADQVSRVYLARCSSAAGETQVVLKCRPQNTLLYPTELTARIEDLLNLQAEKDLLPRRRRTTAGSASCLIACGPQTYTCSVSEYVSGTTACDWQQNQATWSEGQSYSAGKLLAHLHRAGRLVCAKLKDEERSTLASILPLLPEQFASQLSDNWPDKQRVAMVHSLTAAVGLLLATAAITANQTVVHGDFHPGNVLFVQDEAKYAIDFDYAHIENPVYDLAYAGIMFGPERGTSLLRGYSEINSGFDQCQFDCFTKVAAALILLWLEADEIDQHQHSKSSVNTNQQVWKIRLGAQIGSP